MKKLMLIVGILSVFGCHCDKKNPPKPKLMAPVATVKISLNGILYDDAERMIKSFSSYRVLASEKTDIWFSEAFVDDIYSILKYEGGDGIRIYFADKDTTTTEIENSIVIVATKKGSVSPSGYGNPSKYIHNDYFEHNTGLLNSADVESENSVTGKTEGAELYTTNTCAEDHCDPRTEPGYISCDDARKAVTDFKGGQVSTTSVWYSFAIVESLKIQLDAAHVKGVAADGVRIYFGKDAKNVERFIFVRTQANGKIHQDDFLCYTAIVKYRGGNDHGEECPVFCKGVTVP